MDKNKQFTIVSVFFIIGWLLTGCGNKATTQPNAPPVALTNTSGPPTLIPIPFTDTPTAAPPTETPIPPTTTSTPIPPSPTVEPTEEIVATYEPVYETIACRFNKPTGFEVECGVLTVPEDRDQPDGNQVELHVAIYKSRSADPLPDPVFYVTGGGGGNELEVGDRYLDDGNDAILDQRDFIMFNQRGTKFTTPYLQCQGLSRFFFELAFEDLSLDDAAASEVAFDKTCYEQFLAQGIDLNMYNTARNADDLNDLRIALGYDKINIYGTSYGSRYALYALRMYGEHIRSAIIDSVFPPQTRFFSQDPVNVYHTFERLFEQCEADPYCSEQYPDIEMLFYDLVDHLNIIPRWIPVSGTDQLLPYDGTDLISAIYSTPIFSFTFSISLLRISLSLRHSPGAFLTALR